jgi:hypothetical protein
VTRICAGTGIGADVSALDPSCNTAPGGGIYVREPGDSEPEKIKIF